MKFETWYNKNYKKLLVIPAVLILVSLIYVSMFYAQTGAIINRDVTLTGGTSFTIQTDFNKNTLEAELGKTFTDFSVQSIADGSGTQIGLIVTSTEADSEAMQNNLEQILGFELTEANSSIEFTQAKLSEEFFKQLIIAVILAFFWMAAVVFVIFSKGASVKFWIIIGNILFAIFMGSFFFTNNINPLLSGIIFFAFAAVFVRTYIKHSVPAFAVMLSAFADIVMTLALVNMLGMKLSTGGIVAFLMIIGYSVDTDILLTTRILNKRNEQTNSVLKGAFVTGMNMMVTSIIAIVTALIVVYSFSSVLNQIFTILLIGLLFDIVNTWITNASIIKWYAEEKLK